MKKIVVIRLDNMGDMILTTSFLKNLKKGYPDASITLICRPCTKEIVQNISYVDDVIYFDAPRVGGKDTYGTYMQLIRAHKTSFDLGFELHGEIRSIYLLHRLATYTVGFSIRGGKHLLDYAICYDFSFENKTSIVDYQFSLLKHVGVYIEDKGLELKGYEHVHIPQWVTDLHKPLMIAHTGVSVKNRERPIKQRERLFELVEKKHKSTLLIIDTDNDKLCFFENLGYLTYKPQTLTDFFAIVSYANILIGLESLSVHVAAAVGTPCLAIYAGNTPPYLMYPYSEKSIVLDPQLLFKDFNAKQAYNNPNPNIAKITPQMVMEKVDKLI